MRVILSVSPKYQITLVEEIRRIFPFLKSGEKIVVEVDPVSKKLTIEPLGELADFIGVFEDYGKGLSVEEEEKAFEQSMGTYYVKKYGKQTDN